MANTVHALKYPPCFYIALAWWLEIEAHVDHLVAAFRTFAACDPVFFFKVRQAVTQLVFTDLEAFLVRPKLLKVLIDKSASPTF
jgi:hypothetical protein